MSDQVEKWLRHYDPIHRGWTPRGIANGVCATRGFSFPRLAGGYNLYRGASAISAIDFDDPIGAAGANAVQVSTFAWRPAAVDTTYFYALTAIGGGGVESGPGFPPVRVALDGAGVPLPPAPNAPVDLRVTPCAGGCFEIAWRYDQRHEPATPVRFDVYDGPTDDAIDYETPIGSAGYRARAGWFSLSTGVYAHDEVRCFAVRAVTADEVADGNVAVVCCRARAAGSAVHPEVFAELAVAE